MVITRQRSLVPDLARWEGFTEMPARFAGLFDEMLTPARPVPGLGFLPAIDIVDKQDELLITAELPGMNEKNVQLEVDNNILTLKGEKKQETIESNDRYHCWERSYGAFQRTFAIPGTVDSARIKAEFKNGLLEIHLPKTAQAKSRKIEIANP